MTIRPPLDPFSEVVDQGRRWNPEWYSWISGLVSAGAVIDGSSASPGQIGEVMFATREMGSGITLSNAIPQNIVSINLTPGAWLITGQVMLFPSGLTADTLLEAGISPTNATVVQSQTLWAATVAVRANFWHTLNMGPYPISNAGSQVWYLVANQSSSAPIPVFALGAIRALRNR